MSDDAALAALLGALAGDAIGAPYEGSATARTFADGAERRDRALQASTLRFTDDTQLTFALAIHLADDDPDVDPPRLVERILEEFEPWRGYGGGMHRLVARWRDGVDPEVAARELFDGGSYGNGAAMRIVPVGLLWRDDDDRRRAAARRSATLTHAHPLGWEAAVLQADAVAWAARDGGFDVDHLRRLADAAQAPRLRAAALAAADLVHDAPATPSEVVDRLGADVTAPRSVPTAWWVAATATSEADPPSAAVATALALGGDTDTIASMAGGIVGAATRRPPPQTWRHRLEGVARATELAGR